MSLKWTLIRNLTAFWIFGLCNNYAYVIMLSAAEDIMDKQQNKTSNDSDGDQCDVSLSLIFGLTLIPSNVLRQN